VNESAGDHDAALLAGGHGADELGGEAHSFDAFEGFASAGAHLAGYVEIGPES